MPVGTAEILRGGGLLRRGDVAEPLAGVAELFGGDAVETLTDGLGLLILQPDTRINLGPETLLALADFTPETGGTLALAGAMVFERPEGAAPLPVTVTLAGARTAVQGTRFYAGPSQGVAAVFVERGRLEVTAGGVTRSLSAGDGVDLPDGAAPSDVRQWGAARIAEAFARAGL